MFLLTEEADTGASDIIFESGLMSNN